MTNIFGRGSLLVKYFRIKAENRGFSDTAFTRDGDDPAVPGWFHGSHFDRLYVNDKMN